MKEGTGMEKKHYGAPIERGKVLKVADEKPSVESIDRPGIITGPLDKNEGLTVSEGDTVFFCVFEDGSGLVFAKLTAEVNG